MVEIAEILEIRNIVRLKQEEEKKKLEKDRENSALEVSTKVR